MTAAPERAAASSPRPASGRVRRAVEAAVVLALGVFGARALARWVYERGAAEAPLRTAPTADAEAADPSPPPGLASLASLYLDDALGYGVPRRVDFGGVASWLAVSTGCAEPPDVVFARTAARLRTPLPAPSEVKSLLSTIFRAQLTAGVVAGCPFLVQLPPVPGSGGRVLRTEPGAVVLAMPCSGAWDYLAFLFPSGVELESPPAAAAPEPDGAQVLRELSAGLSRQLDAVQAIRLGLSGPAGGSVMLACRTRSGAPASIDALASELASEGWDSRAGRVAPGTRPDATPPAAVVARRGESTAWLIRGGEDDASVFVILAGT